MNDRWQKLNDFIPSVDKTDLKIIELKLKFYEPIHAAGIIL